VEFRILGPVDVWSGGRPLALQGEAQRALLAVLLLHANRPVSADRLIDELWGERAGAGAVKRLQVAISRLRRALGLSAERAGDGVLATLPGGYVLRVGPEQLDSERFERLVAEGRRALEAQEPDVATATLRAALELWRGPALSDVAFASFAQGHIARLEELRLVALEDRIDADLALGRHARLIGELQALVTTHPERERLRGQLMLALYRSGRQAEALDAYRRARAWIVEELGLEPSPVLRNLQDAVLRQDADLQAVPRNGRAEASGPSDAPRRPEAAWGRAARALPAPATALFGREADLERVTALLRDSAVRLVTLAGTGGVGKTRLAVELARRLGDDFTAGVRFVSLAALSDDSHIASTIALALAVPPLEDESPRAALLRFLEERQMLIVLDSFDHLLAGAPLVAELLAACPGLTVLVTSREPLRLSGEHVYGVDPLALPSDAAALRPGELERFGATALFVDRARARDRTFAPRTGDTAHVVAICRRLDGLPLALELAAARVGLLSVRQLAARLDRSLSVLGAGPRDAPARHTTLRATIDWSVRLLTTEEREAFARFAVFAGGATVDVAEAVTGATLDVLDSLVAKQLIVRSQEDRLAMLEITREYAAERLARDHRADEVRERHAVWCLELAEEHAPRLVTARRAASLARLEAEIDNLRAAVSWAIETRRAELAVALAGALGPYWWRAHQEDEGRRWLDAVLADASGASAAARARALFFRGRVNWRLRQRRPEEDLSAAIALFRSAHDDAGMARSLAFLAVAERQRGAEESALRRLREALRVARRADDPDAVAIALSGATIGAADYETASRVAEDAVAALAKIGNVLDVGSVYGDTGFLAIRDGRYAEALPWLEQALAAAREVGDPFSLLVVEGNQGLAHLFLDNVQQAKECFSRSIELCRHAAFHGLVDEGLLGLAAVAVLEDRPARAARLVGAARVHADAATTVDDDVVLGRLRDRFLLPARERFGPERWERCEAEGRALSFADAVNIALEGRTSQPLANERH
jgi:predicted ATPase/DNA-binding SARP family transcriptional activator